MRVKENDLEKMIQKVGEKNNATKQVVIETLKLFIKKYINREYLTEYRLSKEFKRKIEEKNA